MATTTGGSTYVTSTDLVADYPTASLALANRVDVVASGSMSKKTASYTATVGDILAGTTICMNSASATVVTLPSASLVNGMILNVFSVNTGAVTFTGGTVTGAATSITSQYTGVSLTYDSAAAVWWCLPFGAGSGLGIVSATTGSPTVYTGRPNWTSYKFTGTGSITFSHAGTSWGEILVVGGGGGGGRGNATYSGGGGGGGMYQEPVGFVAGTTTVTVGAGGTGKTGTGGQGGDGTQTAFGGYVANGGGGGGGDGFNGRNGACGGGGQTGGTGLNAYNGASGGSTGAGPGGGGWLQAGASKQGGVGSGSGIYTDWVQVSYAGGGAGDGAVSGTVSGGAAAGAGPANQGGGGGGGANGGSGVVIFRVRTS